MDIDKITVFLKKEIDQAEKQRASEILAGNIVKEALLQGELVAYWKIVTFLHTRVEADHSGLHDLLLEQSDPKGRGPR